MRAIDMYEHFQEYGRGPNAANTLTYLSVCSGIEAASVAWHPLGWRAVAFSEIEKFPSAVLKHHYPDVPNLGDFTKIDVSTLGRVDILAGGTPCQAFSVAGLRQSLADARGNLSLEFVRLAHELAASNGLRFDLDGGLVANPLLAKGNSSHDATKETYVPEIARCVATREGSSQDYETTTMVAVSTLDGQDVARTLSARHDGSPCADRGPNIIAFSAKDYGADAAVDLAPTLRSGNHSESHANGGVMPAIAFGGQMSAPQVDVELTQTLQAKNPQAVATTSAVRRLTPKECERLQGFPDDYTLISWRGKPADLCPDGPRYKALGNSWAVPKFHWLGRRISALMSAAATRDNTEMREAA